MNVVTFTKSYPAPGSPVEGTFIRSRMGAAAERIGVTVLHMVPFTRKLAPDDAADRPPVRRARYFYAPGILRGLQARMLAACARGPLRRLRAEGRLDLLDAHFGYPEGAAAVDLARELEVPAVVTLRGTETEFEGRGARGRRMAAAIRGADRVITVSGALRDLALRAGASAGRVVAIGNGADTGLFSPGPRVQARRRLGLPSSGPVLLSVGALIPRKRHDSLIRLLPVWRRSWPGATLVIAGDGPLLSDLRRLSAAEGVEGAVRFAGLVARQDLPEYYRAADLLVLASSREGFANVFFEAFASGIGVVATDVGGAREAVPDVSLGALVPFGDVAALRDAVLAALARGFDPATLRRYACANTWQKVAERVIGVFAEAISARRSAP